MTTVEVLAPLRLETRFVAPADRDDGVPEWLLRLRIYPDEFSIRPATAPPTPAELDRLSEAVAAVPALDEAAAFASFAASVGAGRALLLWRRCVVAGVVDRTAQREPDGRIAVHAPAGLPEELQVWLVHPDGTRDLAATLAPDAVAIGADLDVESFAGSAEIAAGTLPDTWWLSYQRAKDVGLGVDLDVGATPPALLALVVVGVGDTDAADLVDAHNAAGRLAVLAPGTPTNTVEGEPTTDFGDDADTLYRLLHADPAAQQSTRDVLEALTGRLAPDALPVLGGDLDHYGPGSLAVQGFWPVLWGRALRDVITTDRETDLARWAIRHLAVEGPHPAIRVGSQPYGLLPTTIFGRWQADPADELAALEEAIRGWALTWRAGAAAAARNAHAWVENADTEQLLDVYGLHAPSRYWQVRPVAPAAAVAAARILAGMAPMPVPEWDLATAAAWRNRPYPASPMLPVARPGELPGGPPHDHLERRDQLLELVDMHPEPLYYRGVQGLRLGGHLYREALIAARAIVGAAAEQLRDDVPVEEHLPLPVDDENAYRNYVMQGTDEAAAELRASADGNARLVAGRFDEVREGLVVLADLWDAMPESMFRASLAALDTAAFRLDPWLTGIADRRLRTMIAAGAPVKLGAYGWVDAPQPADGRATLAPGPTAAGLLHAPSRDQALTAALLRDAAIRHPDDDRWRLRIDSAKVRSAIALAERVRLGVHPYEALGLEVEKVAGDWDAVRVLRTAYPLAAGQDGRRVCDGAAVLAAARSGSLVAGLPPDLAVRLAPLDEVLDTYADLLMVDGVHAVVTGRADLGNAAMEAAAGLGAPPELRALRTPRSATTVRTSAWVLLPPGAPPAAGGDTEPWQAADPAFAALAAAEGAATTEQRQRLAAVLGGGDPHAPVPSLGDGFAGLPAVADADLRAAVAADLDTRLATVRDLAEAVRATVAALDPAAAGTPATVAALAARWHVDLGAFLPEDPVADRRDALVAALADRLAAPLPAAGTVDEAINARRAAVRAVIGDPGVPVLPVVQRTLLPAFQPAPDLDTRWLEVVAAVRPRLAPLEAHQFRTPWPAALAGPADPWSATGPVLAAYGPGVTAAPTVAIAALDAWTDSVPSSRHTTSAAFGFNSPKSRAPQAILLAVPPDPVQRLTGEGLLEVVLETRELAHARGARPTDRAGLPYATPTPLVHAVPPRANFLTGWPAP